MPILPKTVSVPTKLTSWLYKPGICYPQLHGKEQTVETYLNFALILCSITLNGIMKQKYIYFTIRMKLLYYLH